MKLIAAEAPLNAFVAFGLGIHQIHGTSETKKVVSFGEMEFI